jgi:DNA-binding winged helix-turn-helix (wHTH) protein
VPTKTLVKRLAFKTRYANEENVRQVVKRLRTSLGGIGADDILETVPGRGYFLRCRVSARSR